MFRMDVLLILIAKIVMMPEELKFVFNVLLQPIEFLPFHNMHAFVKKVFMMTRGSANHVPPDAPSAQVLLLAKDVLSLLPTTIMELVHAHKATSSLLNH